MIYTNSQMRSLIDEHVHSAWQREACKLRFCDGFTHEQMLRSWGIPHNI